MLFLRLTKKGLYSLLCVKYVFWYDTRTPFKEILTSIICTNIVNDEIISNETMNNQIKPSSLKQKERRAEWKRCFEKVQNDPTGNHTQEELENSANHKKTLAQNKAQYQRKKRKAAINSRERQRQLINGREYACCLFFVGKFGGLRVEISWESRCDKYTDCDFSLNLK